MIQEGIEVFVQENLFDNIKSDMAPRGEDLRLEYGLDISILRQIKRKRMSIGFKK